MLDAICDFDHDILFSFRGAMGHSTQKLNSASHIQSIAHTSIIEVCRACIYDALLRYLPQHIDPIHYHRCAKVRVSHV
jgi:hypothetical protein